MGVGLWLDQLFIWKDFLQQIPEEMQTEGLTLALNIFYFDRKCRVIKGSKSQIDGRGVLLVTGWHVVYLYINVSVYMDVSKNRGTPNGWFIMVPNPIKIDDLVGFPIFLETPKIHKIHIYPPCVPDQSIGCFFLGRPSC